MRTGSYLNAYFSGDEDGRAAAYRLFAPTSSLPLLTASADGAARAYVRAIKRGAGEYIYPPQYGLVARIHGIAPATTIRLLGIADRLLPETGDESGTVPGMEIGDRIDLGRVWRMLTAPGREAAARFRQRPGPSAVPEPD